MTTEATAAPQAAQRNGVLADTVFVELPLFHQHVERIKVEDESAGKALDILGPIGFLSHQVYVAICEGDQHKAREIALGLGSAVIQGLEISGVSQEAFYTAAEVIEQDCRNAKAALEAPTTRAS
jgi:hypothetical protein